MEQTQEVKWKVELSEEDLLFLVERLERDEDTILAEKVLLGFRKSDLAANLREQHQHGTHTEK